MCPVFVRMWEGYGCEEELVMREDFRDDNHYMTTDFLTTIVSKQSILAITEITDHLLQLLHPRVIRNCEWQHSMREEKKKLVDFNVTVFCFRQ